MRCLQVINDLKYGGAATLMEQWLRGLPKAGCRTDVCTVYRKGQLGKHLEEQGETVYNLGLDSAGGTYRPRNKYDLRVIMPLARLIRSGRYEIVHAHLFPTMAFVALASFLCPRPRFVVSEHSVHNRRRQSPLMKLPDLFVYRRYSRVVAVSEQVRGALLSWLPALRGKVVVVPNGIAVQGFDLPASALSRVEAELGVRPVDRVVLFAGRLTKAKGVDVLLTALSQVSESVPSLRALIAGTGPEMESLQRQAVAQSIDNVVEFLGHRQDVPILMSIADLVVLSSRWEGLPMVLLEAMAARTPVVATTVGGVPELLGHNENAWLVPPEDPLALAQGIEHLLGSPDLCERLGTNAFDKVRAQYSTETATKRLLNVYRAVLQDVG